MFKPRCCVPPHIGVNKVPPRNKKPVSHIGVNKVPQDTDFADIVKAFRETGDELYEVWLDLKRK
jgi:hypothetical protein